MLARLLGLAGPLLWCVLVLLAHLRATTGSSAADCSFDNGDLCGWTNTGAKPWEPLQGSTRSTGTGPAGDHTSGSGTYMYVEASRNAGLGPFTLWAALGGGDGDGGLGLGDASFFYSMYGAAVGSLSLETSTDNATWTEQWAREGDQVSRAQRASTITMDHGPRFL